MEFDDDDNKLFAIRPLEVVWKDNAFVVVKYAFCLKASLASRLHLNEPREPAQSQQVDS